jgi:hypothetical protein
MDTPRCEYCNEPLPHKVVHGRRRRYCSPACRTGAYRERLRHYEALPQDPITLPSDALELLTGERVADTDAQVASALIESQALASVFLRLGREARPPFRWRCIGMGDAIRAALARCFEEAIQ